MNRIFTSILAFLAFSLTGCAVPAPLAVQPSIPAVASQAASPEIKPGSASLPPGMGEAVVGIKIEDGQAVKIDNRSEIEKTYAPDTDWYFHKPLKNGYEVQVRVSAKGVDAAHQFDLMVKELLAANYRQGKLPGAEYRWDFIWDGSREGTIATSIAGPYAHNQVVQPLGISTLKETSLKATVDHEDALILKDIGGSVAAFAKFYIPEITINGAPTDACGRTIESIRTALIRTSQVPSKITFRLTEQSSGKEVSFEQICGNACTSRPIGTNEKVFNFSTGTVIQPGRTYTLKVTAILGDQIAEKSETFTSSTDPKQYLPLTAIPMHCD